MKNLTKYCRYYRGEKKCPEDLTGNKNMFWFYEKIWTEREEARDENNDDTMDYILYGLKDFSAQDGTPITLKSMLLNRYCHWLGGWGMEDDVRGFKKWYVEEYLDAGPQKDESAH